MDLIPDFIRRKQGKVPITYEVPALEEILKETYGVIVYQEQVMAIANKAGGFSLGQADLMRRAMGDRKSTRLNSSHGYISYAVFCLKKKKKKNNQENE